MAKKGKVERTFLVFEKELFVPLQRELRIRRWDGTATTLDNAAFDALFVLHNYLNVQRLMEGNLGEADAGGAAGPEVGSHLRVVYDRERNERVNGGPGREV